MEVVYTATVKQDEENVAVINPTDSLNKPAKVDGGLTDVTVDEGGGAEWALDASDANNLTVVLKSDLTATEFPATTTTRGKIDADLGSGRRDIDITLITITIPAEAVTAGISDSGNRPRS